MLAAPLPNADERRDNASFDALLWALSRPGQIRELPQAGDTAILSALIDRECRVFCADPRLMPIAAELGAEIADLPCADHAFLGRLDDVSLLAQLAAGSDLYPDDGATAILHVRHDTGPAVRLTGPGVNGALAIRIGGLPEGFWAMRKSLIRYPMGFDLFLIDGRRVMGLPRSTQIEVL